MLSEADFMASAPDEDKKDPDGKPLGPHDLMLKRLAHEYQERKQLCATLEELKTRKQVRFNHLSIADPNIVRTNPAFRTASLLGPYTSVPG